MIKLLYKILPKPLQDRFKLKYYNYRNKKYQFDIKQNIYSTSAKDLATIYTVSPLYFVVKDIDKYEKYYKVKAKDVVLDCGANDGAISLAYSKKVGENGKVFSFEPDSKNVLTFNKNKALNTNCKNINLIEKGIWDKQDTLVFFESGTVGSSVFYEGEHSRKIEIDVISIDGFLNDNNLKSIDFIKMDIEGAEIEALEGAVDVIEKHRPSFAIASYHIVNGKATYIALEAFFKRINYPFKTEFFKDGEIITYAGNHLKN